MSTAGKDYLWLNISSLPYFRGLLRAVEARVYENLELPSPSLDLGCGDGHFSQIAFNNEVSVGLDPWSGTSAAGWAGTGNTAMSSRERGSHSFCRMAIFPRR